MFGVPVGWALQRYWISIVAPTVTVWSIYADWSHTQEWKKSLQNKDVVGKVSE